MSLRNTFQPSANKHLVQNAMPRFNWLNPNGAIFGGWTMYQMYLAAFKLFKNHGDVFERDTGAGDFTLNDFKFVAPALPNKDLSFYASLVDGVTSVEAVDGDNKIIASSDFRFLGNLREEHHSTVLEMMCWLDIFAGLELNDFESFHQSDFAYVTSGIENLEFYNLERYPRHSGCQKLFQADDLDAFSMKLLGHLHPYVADFNGYKVSDVSALPNDKSALSLYCRGTHNQPYAMGEIIFAKRLKNALIAAPERETAQVFSFPPK